jgi:hypothetical protein
MRAQCNLWGYLETLLVIIATIKRPPGKNKNYPEVLGDYSQPQKKPRKTGLVLATKLF